MADAARLHELLDAQDGVIARRQVMDCGFTAPYIRCRIRRREWVAVYPGTYVNHTGPLTWRQRAWAAVLDAWPAALSHASAVGDTDDQGAGPIHITVARRRRVTRRAGVVVHYAARFDEQVLGSAHPPRQRLEEAALDMVGLVSSEMRAVACLTDVVQARKTTAERLLAALQTRPRMRWRAFVEQVLCDARDGTCSVLEYGYLTKVERAHGLPTPQRQSPTRVGRNGFRDVDYLEWNVVVELDGRLGHDDGLARDRDMERDLDAAAGADRETLRIGWGQVYTRACSTAVKIGTVLNRHGWPGEVASCPQCVGGPEVSAP
ncbi:hypothetical protein AAFP30_09800 [Gordonia sp. CPCC 205515]|uniref:hypothetical protein n=1 Tax=Gordonia sp. CPCC 205515 TaxID=3140791 RepID=UPI003AF3C324